VCLNATSYQFSTYACCTEAAALEVLRQPNLIGPSVNYKLLVAIANGILFQAVSSLQLSMFASTQALVRAAAAEYRPEELRDDELHGMLQMRR
jgi:hypothetical protein